MPDYQIKDVWRCGVKRWLVLHNEFEVARFDLRRDAVNWILEQERKQRKESEAE